MNNVYKDNGFKNREDYLDFLAEEYETPRDIVQELADVNGPSEDFDGLVTTLQDVMEGNW